MLSAWSSHVEGTQLRIGQGFDLHPLGEGRPFPLGGVIIPTSDGRGPLGHSDGDPLLHAVIDAILGSVAMGDIGGWFPDTDDAWKDTPSANLLRLVLEDPCLQGWKLINLDCTIFTSTPRLSPYIHAIRESLANLLGTDAARISVKSKSGNGLGDAGQGRAVAAQAIVLADVSTLNHP